MQSPQLPFIINTRDMVAKMKKAYDARQVSVYKPGGECLYRDAQGVSCIAGAGLPDEVVDYLANAPHTTDDAFDTNLNERNIGTISLENRYGIIQFETSDFRRDVSELQGAHDKATRVANGESIGMRGVSPEEALEQFEREANKFFAKWSA